MKTKERFILYLKFKNLGQTAFEESAGLSRGTISQKSGFSANSIEKIAAICPDLNLDWLITGNGEMLKSPLTDKGNMNTSFHGDFSKPIIADVKNTMGDTVIGHNAQNKSNNIQNSSNEELLRAKMEIEYLQKEIEKLNVSLEHAISDKERALADRDKIMAMLEKIINK